MAICSTFRVSSRTVCAAFVLALLASGLGVPAASAAVRLQGTVTDAEGRALEGVHVHLRLRDDRPRLESRTDRRGRWSLHKVPPGEWRVVFRLRGYFDHSVQRTVYAAKKKNTPMQVKLRRAPFAAGLASAQGAPPPGVGWATDSSPLDADPRVVADALYTQGQYAEALQRYERLLAEGPASAELHEKLGNSYARLGSYDRAREHYEQVYRLQPDSTTAIGNLAEVCLRKKDLAGARKYLDELLERAPEHPTANFNMAEILLGSGEAEDAMRHYEAALASRPEWAAAHLRLGYAAVSLGRADKARTAFERYLQLEPEGAEAPLVRETLQLLK
jgi:Flp pilus assembly protein TadD